MNRFIQLLATIILLSLIGCNQKEAEKERLKIYGWNILTDHTPTANRTLEASEEYDVNQLQLSHEICHDLKDVKHQWNRNIVKNLTSTAHDMGIPDVFVWDHALYDLDYYPDRFKIRESGLINLDNPVFWKWLKADYRKMLDKIPKVDGIVLTFTETGARIENQHSEVLKTPQEKMAALVDSLASVIMGERNMKLIIRSLMYDRTELDKLLKCLDLIKTRDILVMAKETPYDFFVTHPVSPWIEKIPFPVIIEFDAAHEYSGQGIVASIFPEIQLNRWKYYEKLPNVIGFSIRTDRLGKTSILGRPSEINLFAIHEATKNPEIEIDEVIEKYITKKYDSAAVSHLKPVFELAPGIILASYYTLGLNTTDHSQLDFDYRSIYTRHVSGRWMDNPEVVVGHGVDRTFHFWSDIVNHLAPTKYKIPTELNLKEIPEVFDNNWLQSEELIDTVYLNYILTEKEYGVERAKEAVALVNAAKPYIFKSREFNILYHTFNRTLMSARLRKAYAQVYYARRIWNRGKEFQTEKLKLLVSEGVEEIKTVSAEMKNYRRKGPVGQYDWVEDADIAMKLVREVENSEILKKQ